jgi:hypothetical protein
MVQGERKAWDQRITERWARQARGAANNPRMRKGPSFRESIRSPYYWLALIVLGVGVLVSRFTSVGEVAFFVGSIVAFAVMGLDARRLRARKRESSGSDGAWHSTNTRPN